MEPTRNLLDQVRRKQLLVCAYEPPDAPAADPLRLEQVSEIMQIGTAECEALVRRLRARGLVVDADDAVRLTDRGRRLLSRMTRPEPQATSPTTIGPD